MDGLLRTAQDKIYKRLTTTSKRLYSPGAALNVARAGFSISQTLQVSDALMALQFVLRELDRMQVVRLILLKRSPPPNCCQVS